MSRPGWIDRLPTGWSAQRLRHVADVNNSNVDKKSYEDGTPVRLCNYTDVYYNEYIVDDMPLMRATATRQEIERFTLRPGDVIITKDSESWDDIAIPACVAEPLDGVVCGYHLTLLRPVAAMLEGRFLLRALQATGVREQFWLAANGVTRFGVGLQGIKDALLPIPPRSAQRVIADFLDEKTAAIDALIDEKKRLLDLLAEKRAALINRAVTRGLDPDVPMKDSGVPWIGEIPAHWETRRLKYLVDEAMAGPYGSSLTKAMYTNSGYRVYGQQQVIPDDFTIGDYYISDAKFAEMRRYEVHPGDVLVSVMGTVGRVAVVPPDVEPGIMNPRLVRYRPSDRVIHPRFMQLAILAHCSQEFLALRAQGATMDGLNMGTLGELVLAIPPLDVQRELLSWARRVTSEIDDACAWIAGEVQLLAEYRQSLITAAVTGQLDIA